MLIDTFLNISSHIESIFSRKAKIKALIEIRPHITDVSLKNIYGVLIDEVAWSYVTGQKSTLKDLDRFETLARTRIATAELLARSWPYADADKSIDKYVMSENSIKQYKSFEKRFNILLFCACLTGVIYIISIYLDIVKLQFYPVYPFAAMFAIFLCLLLVAGLFIKKRLINAYMLHMKCNGQKTEQTIVAS